MIRKVKFSNFYSFKESHEIDFLAKKKRSYSYYNSQSGDQITKIAGFIGGNAAGKTNIMRLLSFIRHFVKASNKEDSAQNFHMAFKTFFNNKLPSDFYIEFEKDDQIFFYEFSVAENILQRECLFIKRIRKNSRKIAIFQRNKEKVTLNDTYIKGFKSDFVKNIRPDMSLIAFLKAHYDIEIINAVYSYFSEIKTNLTEDGQINPFAHQVDVLNLYLRDPDLKKQMEEFICNFDLGLKNFEIHKEMNGDEYTISVAGVHQTETENNKLPFAYESRGTRSLFFTIGNILYALKNNTVVVIDEIEYGFHPEALNKLIGYFIDESHDKCSQLIFSSQSLGFLNNLDMHQVYLVAKDQKGESVAYKLSQVEKIRSDDNFLSKYMSGAYGAFPEIRV